MDVGQEFIFNPSLHRNEFERGLVGDHVIVVDDRGWEKQIDIQDGRGTKIWVANGELRPVPLLEEGVTLDAAGDFIDVMPS